MLKSKCCGADVDPAMINGHIRFICSVCHKSSLAEYSMPLEQPKVTKKVTKKSTLYTITHKGKEIVVEKHEDGRLTIEPNKDMYNNDGFVVMNSKPEMVKAIGEMIVRASAL